MTTCVTLKLAALLHDHPWALAFPRTVKEDNMLFRAIDLVRGQKVEQLPLGTSFHEAIGIMTKYDFSQIPITDENGVYLGLLSEHGVVKHLHKVRYEQSALNDTIDRWYDRADAAYLDIDIGQALGKLKAQSALVIVDAQRHPIAVVTYDDVAGFYGTYAYGFMLLEYIERTLRRYIEAVYPDPSKRNEMTAKAPSGDGAAASAGDHRPERYEDFTLQNYVDAIKSRRCWDSFAPFFGAKKSFEGTFRGVNQVRNDAMHFHGDRLGDDQIQALEYTARYLENCERLHPPSPDLGSIRRIDPYDDPEFIEQMLQPYEPDPAYGDFAKWLTKHGLNNGVLKPMSVKFADIEAVMGKQLPSQAYSHEGWWHHEWDSSPSFSWNHVHWEVVYVDLKVREVVLNPHGALTPDA